MRNIALAADAAMEIPGALGIAVVDERTGEVIIQIGGGGDLSLGLATTINSKLVRANTEMTTESKSLNRMEDILVTFETQYHIIRPIACSQHVSGLFFFLALDRRRANLAMARHKLAEIERHLDFSFEELETLKEFRPRPTTYRSQANAPRTPSTAEEDEDIPPFMREGSVRKLVGLK